jgi:hypothetical protein
VGGLAEGEPEADAIAIEEVGHLGHAGQLGEGDPQNQQRPRSDSC